MKYSNNRTVKASPFISRLQLTTAKTVAFLFVWALSLGCRKEKNQVCGVYDSETGYAVGTIESYTSSPFKVVYKYEYTINGATFTGKEKAYGIGQKDERLVGKQFVVVYELNDLSNSDLNTNYLIETSQDFDEFQAEFSSEPPPPDFPNNCD